MLFCSSKEAIFKLDFMASLASLGCRARVYHATMQNSAILEEWRDLNHIYKINNICGAIGSCDNVHYYDDNRTNLNELILHKLCIYKYYLTRNLVFGNVS